MCFSRLVRATMVASLLGPLVAASCSPSPRTEPTVLAPSLDAPAPREFPGLHQVVTFHPGVISGGVPEGEGFATLAAMGVKTVISVDGGAPDVAAAKAAGIRYIHLPMGYDGCEESRVLELTRATRDSMTRGGVYIHCHHGKHRSPAASAAVAVSMGWMTPEQAIDRMRFAGTAANYTGLFDDVAACSVLPDSAIDAVNPDFPEVCMPKGMVKGMVEIDMVFDHIKEIRKAGWKTPPAHPDLVPAAEAGRLADLFRALADDEESTRHGPEFVAIMKTSHGYAKRLEDLIVAGDGSPGAMGSLVQSLAADCKACHATYRD
ncbi:MAG: hypothetical protein ACOYPS_10655 [Phycisphaerales bacterium]